MKSVVISMEIKRGITFGVTYVSHMQVQYAIGYFSFWIFASSVPTT